MDPLLKLLEAEKVRGAKVRPPPRFSPQNRGSSTREDVTINFPAMMFMDDLLLLGSNRRQTERLFKISQKFAKLNGAVLNPEKTAIFHQEAEEEAKILATFLGVPEGPSSNLDYLGVHSNDDSHIANRTRKTLAAFFLTRQAGARNGPESFKANLIMISHVLLPILHYGNETKSLSQANLTKLDKCLAKIVRIALNLPRASPTYWVLWEAGIPTARTHLGLVKAKRWRKQTDKLRKWRRDPNSEKQNTRRTPIAPDEDLIHEALRLWRAPPEAHEEVPNEVMPISHWGPYLTSLAEESRLRTFQNWSLSTDSLLPTSRRPDFWNTKMQHRAWALLTEVPGSEHLPNDMVEALLRLRARSIGLPNDFASRSRAPHKRTEEAAAQGRCPLCFSTQWRCAVPEDWNTNTFLWLCPALAPTMLSNLGNMWPLLSEQTKLAIQKEPPHWKTSQLLGNPSGAQKKVDRALAKLAMELSERIESLLPSGR
jgi:hypothetical protein